MIDDAVVALHSAALNLIAACTPSVLRAAFFKGNPLLKIARRGVLKSLAASLCLPALAHAQGGSAPIRLAMIEGLSGGNANGGEAVFRNLVWAVERVNARGGVTLALERYDSKGQVEEARSRPARARGPEDIAMPQGISRPRVAQFSATDFH